MPEPISSPYEDFQRTGAKKMIQLAKLLCALVARFKPVMLAKFSDNPAIVGLIAAIEVACGFIPDAELEFAAFNLNETLPESDPAEIAGVDPSAPEPEEPDFAG